MRFTGGLIPAIATQQTAQSSADDLYIVGAYLKIRFGTHELRPQGVSISVHFDEMGVTIRGGAAGEEKRRGEKKNEHLVF